MLKRVRIEVEGEESAAATEMALTKYEHALQVVECQRFDVGGMTETVHAHNHPEPIRTFRTDRPVFKGWNDTGRDYADFELGRQVTDEVIEFDPSLPGYKGRRIVKFTRLDTRMTDPPSENLTAAGIYPPE